MREELTVRLQDVAVAIQVTRLTWEWMSAHKLLCESQHLKDHQGGTHLAFFQPAAVCEAEQLGRRALSANESDRRGKVEDRWGSKGRRGSSSSSSSSSSWRRCTATVGWRNSHGACGCGMLGSRGHALLEEGKEGRLVREEERERETDG